jgi:hypothetical protein
VSLTPTTDTLQTLLGRKAYQSLLYLAQNPWCSGRHLATTFHYSPTTATSLLRHLREAHLVLRLPHGRAHLWCLNYQHPIIDLWLHEIPGPHARILPRDLDAKPLENTVS